MLDYELAASVSHLFDVLSVLESARDRSSEFRAIAHGECDAASRSCDDFTASGIVSNDNRSPSKESFEWTQTKDFERSGIDHYIAIDKHVELLWKGNQASEQHVLLE